MVTLKFDMFDGSAHVVGHNRKKNCAAWHSWLVRRRRWWGPLGLGFGFGRSWQLHRRRIWALQQNVKSAWRAFGRRLHSEIIANLHSPRKFDMQLESHWWKFVRQLLKCWKQYKMMVVSLEMRFWSSILVRVGLMRWIGTLHKFLFHFSWEKFLAFTSIFLHRFEVRDAGRHVWIMGRRRGHAARASQILNVRIIFLLFTIGVRTRGLCECRKFQEKQVCVRWLCNSRTFQVPRSGATFGCQSCFFFFLFFVRRALRAPHLWPAGGVWSASPHPNLALWSQSQAPREKSWNTQTMQIMRIRPTYALQHLVENYFWLSCKSSTDARNSRNPSVVR